MVVIGGIASVLALVAALGVWWRAGHPSAPELDDNLVAVAPFELLERGSGTSLEVWREGLVDVLSRDLDGAGPLRTVSPSVVLRHATADRRMDRATARAAALQSGAGIVVYGQLIAVAGDSVRAMVTALATRTDSVLGDVEVRNSLDRMDQVADSITLRVLRELGRSRSIAAVPRTFFGARSLPALKAFLHGEQAYRRNDFVAARVAYEEAISLDSGLAVAYRRMRGVLRGLSGDEFDSTSLWYAARAGERNRGNSVRDSLLIVADSLATMHTPGSPITGAWLTSLRRRAESLDRASDLFPQDPEVWTERGELQAHSGAWIGATDRDALYSFRKALAIDSVYGPAFYHAIDLAVALEPPASVLPLVRRYRRLNPSDLRFEFVERALSGESIDELERRVRALSGNDARLALIVFRRDVSPSDLFTTLYSRLAASPPPGRSEASLANWLFAGYLYRGRVGAALAAIPQDGLHGQLSDLLTGVLASTGLAGPRRQELTRVLAAEKSAVSLLDLFPAFASPGGDTTVWNALGSRDAGCRRRATPLVAVTCEALIAPFRALQRGDTAAALRAFAALPDSVRYAMPVWPRLSWADLLLARGRAVEAAKVLDDHPPPSSPTFVSEVRWRFSRGRAAKALGDKARAVEEFARVAAAWRSADSEPYLSASREASEAVARLRK
jgi:serine/threonine-protein kinase